MVLPARVAAAASMVVLLTAAPAAAHVVATPAFLASGSDESVTFTGPNERDAPMTSFSVTAPPGLVVEHAHDVEGWDASFDETTATWTGGSLPVDVEGGFGLTLRADAEPGVLELTAEQRYDDGGVVSWPVPLTVTPAEESPSQNLALAGVVGLLGVLVVIAVVMLAWRRRTPRIPEPR